MRTKTLLLTAAVSVAGVASSMAQAVYSVNTVGYVNLTLKPGFSMIQNPLKAADNSIKALLASVPDGTTVFTFVNGNYAQNGFEFGEWATPGALLEPGNGFFIRIPGNANVVVTFVGEVLQGPLETAIPAGFSIKGSQVPQKGQLDTILGFPAAEGDAVFRFVNGAFAGSTFEFGAWDSAPVVEVGEAFFVRKAAAAAWKRTFSTN